MSLTVDNFWLVFENFLDFLVDGTWGASDHGLYRNERSKLEVGEKVFERSCVEILHIIHVMHLVMNCTRA